MEILRFITAGSVDDGKSTLIGRLLFDSKNILVDQLESLQKQSKNVPAGEIDLALLTDGLRAEREQGITIDVAYKYFNTSKRKFIIADAPGHIQYTRNMITGASNSEAMVILIDARNGVIEQTKRHSYIAAMLSLPNVIVAVNKMDLVNYSQDVFNEIKDNFMKMSSKINFDHITFIPISALSGENIVSKSNKMNWYEGPSLIHLLENIPVNVNQEKEGFIFQVQFVNRPQTSELHDFRGFIGKVLDGKIKKDDEIQIHPSGLHSKIKSIIYKGEIVEEVNEGLVCTIETYDDIDISRGDLIVNDLSVYDASNESKVLLCWMSEHQLQLGSKYTLQQNSFKTKALIQDIIHKVDIHSYKEETEIQNVLLNDIVSIKLKTQKALLKHRKSTQSALNKGIIIDETTHNTVGAFIIQE